MKIPQDREKLINGLEYFTSSVRYSEETYFTRRLLLKKTHRALHALKKHKDNVCVEAMKELVCFLGDKLDSPCQERLRFDIASLLKRIYADCALEGVATEVLSLRGRQIVRASIHEDSGHTDETTVTDETAYNGWFCDGGYTDHTDIHTDVPARDEVKFDI